MDKGGSNEHDGDSKRREEYDATNTPVKTHSDGVEPAPECGGPRDLKSECQCRCGCDLDTYGHDICCEQCERRVGILCCANEDAVRADIDACHVCDHRCHNCEVGVRCPMMANEGELAPYRRAEKGKDARGPPRTISYKNSKIKFCFIYRKRYSRF